MNEKKDRIEKTENEEKRVYIYIRKKKGMKEKTSC